MTANVFRYASEARARGVRDGRNEGQAEGVLLVLQGRGLTASTDLCEQILACTDPERLRDWLMRAGTVGTPDDLLR
ncbi:hypothetical protein AB0L06_36780 [Spirillospora sp. NPDC052269]